LSSLKPLSLLSPYFSSFLDTWNLIIEYSLEGFDAILLLPMTPFSSIPEALEALKAGKFVIVVDDEDRENEGDLVLPAEHITKEKMAFMIRYTGGVVCMPLTDEIANQLHLPPMVSNNTSKLGTPFTVSIDAAEGTTTGISAEDRTVTVRSALRPDAKPSDFRQPGHIFPLRAKNGGVLVRAGHTEATIDLCLLAGSRPIGVLSELMHDDGTMMRLPALIDFAKKHEIPLINIGDLIAWRRKNEMLVRFDAESDLETKTGLWKIRVYTDLVREQEHVALIKGTIRPSEPILVRVHSECLTGDALGSHHCDCGEQLRIAMQRIEKEGSGVLLYVRQEGRGIGLANKIRAYDLQQKEGLDTVQANIKLGFKADLREYGIGAQILRDVGVRSLRLLTNNPKKVIGLQGYGLNIAEQLPLTIASHTVRQKKYLDTKKKKLGHLLP
jgi:3,4-dihydroxy 2-butanone 4-phosphate synthase/GTP cyclohydrolase II